MNKRKNEERYVLLLNSKNVDDIKIIEYLERKRSIDNVPYSKTLRKGLVELIGKESSEQNQFFSDVEREEETKIIQQPSIENEEIDSKPDGKRLILDSFNGFSTKDLK